MPYRPHPNRERARRQVERHRPATRTQPQPSFSELVAYLNSDEHRAKMRRIGTTMADLMRRVQESARKAQSTEWKITA
ncbi:hypothetical protein [Streptomyces spiralis]